MLDFTPKELKLMKGLNSPARVQNFLNKLPFNFEKRGETLMSPVMVVRTKRAHCFEGALLGAYILSRHGFPPLVLHLKTIKEDYDHVVAPFKLKGHWGALSKTNHAVLRYREPVYKNIHELVMSYFHEYYLDNGEKSLRQYSKPLNLNIFGSDWMLQGGDLWEIDKKLDKIKHYDIISKAQIKKLRRADKIEIKAGDIAEYKK